MGTGASRPLQGSHTITFVRYIDVGLVIASAPLVLLAGMPALGYAFGAAAWILTRVATDFLHGKAASSTDPRTSAALHVGAMMGRVWMAALAVIGARYIGSTDDAITCAVVLLAAFTVQLMVTLTLRGEPGKVTR